MGSKIYGIVEADLLSVAEATSLRSRLLFADAQVFGRFAQAALHEVGKVCSGRTPSQNRLHGV